MREIVARGERRARVTAGELYTMLRDDFGLEGATGHIAFTLKDFRIIVKQNNVVGNLLEE